MAERMLEKRVIVDKECVTYRLLSRLLNVHVKEAKKELQAFHESAKHKTHATFLVMGTPPAPASNGHAKLELTSELDDDMEVDEKPAVVEEEVVPRTICQLVQEEELEACKARFGTVKSVQVYSVEPKRLMDIALVVAANQTIETDERCKKNIAASKNGQVFGVIQLPPRKTYAAKKPAAPSSPQPQRPVAGPSKSAAAAASAAKAKVEAKPALSNSLKRKAEPAPAPVAAKPVSTDKGKAKAVIPSSDGMDWDAAAEEEMLRAEREAMEGGGDDSMDVDAPAKSSAPSTQKTRVRKTRTVKKVVRDAKGNRHTEEVEESYSEDEGGEPAKAAPPKAKATGSTSAAPPKKPAASTSTTAKKPAPAPAATKKAPTDAAGQTSLNSFFAKPKGKK